MAEMAYYGILHRPVYFAGETETCLFSISLSTERTSSSAVIMPLSGFFDAISQIAKFSRRWDDDFCDKLNHKFSSITLVTLTVVVSCKQYVGEPIVCWCPGSWTGAMVDYAHQICWISNTYYLPYGVAPLTKDQPRESVLIYYQWVPFILLGQALAFQFPNIVWRSFSQFIGMDLDRMSRTVSGIENVNPELRDRTVRTVVKQMDRALAISAWRSNGTCAKCLKKSHRYLCIIGCGRGLGNYLITLYICCKVLYVGIGVGQLFGLNYLLGAEDLGIHYIIYGYKIIDLFINGQTDHLSSKIFPRVTMCDFTIRQMANFQDFTIECTLPINLFNEKIFVFIWFWLHIITVANICSLLVWIGSTFSVSRESYVKKYLGISERMRRTKVDRKHIKCFVEYYLRQDGVFAFKILSQNTNDVVVAEIVCKLWDHFILHHRHRKEFHYPHHSDAELEVERKSPHRPTNLFEALQLDTVVSPTTPGNIFP